jgi:predicted GIY-YIG superfamily endonuclease
MMSKNYFVYILWSAFHKRFYIGVTDDVKRRLDQHNAGISKWTRGRGPWVIVWQRLFSSLSEARRFENRLKKQKGGNKFFEYTGLDPAKFKFLL